MTEDAHTALKLQRMGWNTAYIGARLSAGLATERLVLHIGQRSVGAVVDGVSDVLTLEREQMRPMPALRGDIAPEHLLAIGSVGKRMLILLDIEKFLANSVASGTPAACH